MSNRSDKKFVTERRIDKCVVELIKTLYLNEPASEAAVGVCIYEITELLKEAGVEVKK